MDERSHRAMLELVEARLGAVDPADSATLVAFAASQLVEIDEEELAGALRRTMLILAAGGNPNRELRADDRAVTALAADLDEPGRREALAGAIAQLETAAEGLPRVAEALKALAGDPGLAWLSFAAALLAEELATD